MSKRIITLLFTSSLLLGACASEENDLTVEDTDTEKIGQVEEVEEEEELESVEGSRSNPVPINKTVSQDFEFYGHNDDGRYNGNRSITLSNFVRGEEVYNYLMEANQFNEEAPENMEWAMIDVDYTLNEADTDDEAQYVMSDFVIVDSAGSEVAQDKVYPTLKSGDEFGYVELYSGGTAEGKYVFYIPEADEVLIKFDDWNAKPIFFDPNK